MGIKFRGIDAWAYDDVRIKKLTDRQFRIWAISTTSDEAKLCKGVGIFKQSTHEFTKQIPIEEVQDELGRTELEICMQKYGKVVVLTEEEKKGKIGLFPISVIEYDPETDMINNKLMYEYSSHRWLSTAKSLIEGIHSDYEEFGDRTPERWWAEFANTNLTLLKQKFAEYQSQITQSKKRKNEFDIKPAEKTMQKLIELGERFSPSNIPDKIVDIEKMKDTIEKIKNLSSSK